MGPSPLGDGKQTLLKFLKENNISLQWGRRLLATESLHGGQCCQYCRELQWGRRLLATERTRGRC